MTERPQPSRDTVIEAIEKNNSPWRSLDRVAEETGIKPFDIGATARELNLTGDVGLYERENRQGELFITTRRHYQQTAGIVRRMLSVIVDRPV